MAGETLVKPSLLTKILMVVALTNDVRVTKPAVKKRI